MPLKKYRVPYDTPAVDQETKEAYALADKHVPKYKQAYLLALGGVADVISQAVYNVLRSYYDITPAILAAEITPEVKRAWHELYLATVDKTLDLWRDTSNETRTIVKDAKAIYDEFAGKPELTDAAVTYADLHSSALVTSISEGTLIGVRGVIAQGIAEQKHPRIVAKRVKDLGIGLAERGPHTYDRVQRYMIAQMEAGVPDRILEARVKRFHDKLIKERAESIAQTEMVRAQNSARIAVWQEERSLGLIDARAVKVWIAGVARTCGECQALDGSEAPIDQPFDSGDMGPPAHPRCRCTMGLRLS